MEMALGYGRGSGAPAARVLSRAVGLAYSEGVRRRSMQGRAVWYAAPAFRGVAGRSSPSEEREREQSRTDGGAQVVASCIFFM